MCPERAGSTFWEKMRSASGFGVAQCFVPPLRGTFWKVSGLETPVHVLSFVFLEKKVQGTCYIMSLSTW